LKESISLYKGRLTSICVLGQIKKLKLAFPKLPAGFYEILSERIKAHNFTDERLKDAVNRLIDSYDYPIPTIANIISWDKRVKILSYHELMEHVNKYGENTWEAYKGFTRNGVRFYISKFDMEQFNIKIKNDTIYY